MKADLIFLKKTEMIDYMKKKGMFFLCCTSLILVSTAMDAHAFTDKRTTEVKKASPWYGTQITLPRNGWWYSTTRKATQNTQGMKASKNKYKMIGEITNVNNEKVSTTKTFSAKNKTAQYSRTYMTGAKTKVRYKSSAINVLTNSGYLEWRP